MLLDLICLGECDFGDYRSSVLGDVILISFISFTNDNPLLQSNFGENYMYELDFLCLGVSDP